jgi:hypothetical protein
MHGDFESENVEGTNPEFHWIIGGNLAETSVRETSLRTKIAS